MVVPAGQRPEAQVQDWFKQNGIDQLDWPSYSPDLNPIENLWALLKRRVEKRLPKSLEKLKSMLQEEWKAIDVETLQKLVYSMPSRCQLVREKAGWMSGY